MATKKITKAKTIKKVSAAAKPKTVSKPVAAAEPEIEPEEHQSKGPEENAAASSTAANTDAGHGNSFDPVLEPGASPFNSTAPMRDSVAPPPAPAPEQPNLDDQDSGFQDQPGNSAGAPASAPAPAPAFRAPRFRFAGGQSEEELIQQQMASGGFDMGEPEAGSSAESGIPGDVATGIGKGTASFLLDVVGNGVNMVFQEVSQLPEAAIEAEAKDNRPEVVEDLMDNVRHYNEQMSKQAYWNKNHRQMIEGPLQKYLEISGWGEMSPAAQLGMACLMVSIMLFMDMKKLLNKRDQQFKSIMESLTKPANVVPNQAAA